MLKLVIHNRENAVRAKNIVETFGSQWYVDNSFRIIDAIMIPKHPPRGIFESFKKCIQIAKESGADRVIVFEDDVKFLRSDSLSDFIEYSNSIPDTFDLYMGGVYSGNIIPINENVGKIEGEFNGLHCTMFNSKFYDKFLSIETDKNIDYVISCGKYVECESYCAYPMLVIQNDGYSDNVKSFTNYNQILTQQYKLKL